MAGRLIHDWHPFGMLSVREMLEHSSDVGAIKVALRLGAPQFYDTIRAFGIGQLDRNRVAGRKPWAAAAAGKLDGELDWVVGHGAGSQRYADSDYFRDFGGGERWNAVPPAIVQGNSRRMHRCVALRARATTSDGREDCRDRARE